MAGKEPVGATQGVVPGVAVVPRAVAAVLLAQLAQATLNVEAVLEWDLEPMVASAPVREQEAVLGQKQEAAPAVPGQKREALGQKQEAVPVWEVAQILLPLALAARRAAILVSPTHVKMPESAATVRAKPRARARLDMLARVVSF